MSNKSQLQENNATLEYVMEQLQDMPTTEDCMRAVDNLAERVTPIEFGGTGASTAEGAALNLGVPIRALLTFTQDNRSSTKFSYPQGFTKSNSYIISVMHNKGNTREQFNEYVPIVLRDDEIYVNLKPGNSSLLATGDTIEILLEKYEG